MGCGRQFVPVARAERQTGAGPEWRAASETSRESCAPMRPANEGWHGMGHWRASGRETGQHSSKSANLTNAIAEILSHSTCSRRSNTKLIINQLK